ncbi:MAG TPA: hypothetical protein VK165_14500 [Azonexus sp.]|nr:hypothetical protein [Azonexus sp.]
MKIRLLYLNTHRLSAYAWQQGNLLSKGAFDNDEEGLRQFSHYLATRRNDRFALLANVAEEGHAYETIPFLHGPDRQTLISRKIGQHFQGTSLATAISLGYEKTQRKNEKLLFAAFTNPAHFEPWLQRLGSAEVALSGIYSVAQLGGLLLKKLGLGGGRCLLLSMQDHSIRSSYLADGQAHFSRMAPLTDSSIAGIASTFAIESGKLHQYLISQRLIGRDEALPVFIVAHPLTLPAIEKACPDRGQLSFRLIDSHTAAAKLSLHTLPEDNRCDPLFMHLLAIAPPRQQFGNATHRHHFRLSQLRNGLLAAGFIAVLGSVLYSAKQAYDAHDLREEASTLAAHEADLNQRYRATANTLPQLDIDNDTLRQLTTRYAELSRQQRRPDPAFVKLSQALDRMPTINLEGIEWKNDAYDPAKEAEMREVTIVRGSVNLPQADPRKVLEVFDRFVDTLRSQPDVAVNVQQRPFDIESGSALRGGDGQEETAKPRQFTIEIVRREAP